MIFNNSKYTLIYFKIINQARARTLTGYKERHHIIPRSLGGNNESENLIDLTGREHYLLHWLLIKMTDGTNRSKMLYAFWRMNTNRKYRITSRTYDMIKKENAKSHSERMSGKNNPFYGKKHTPEMHERLLKMRKLQKWTTERKENWRGRTVGENNPMFGKIHSPESRAKISKAATGRVLSQEQKNNLSDKLKGKPLKVNSRKITCPHCNREMDLGNASKHHFDNCKMNPNYVPKPKRTYNKIK